MRAPSMTAYGALPRVARSLNVPGSPSAPLTTTVVGSAAVLFSRIVRHLRPVGKPAPPRPRRPEASISASTASASTFSVASSPRPPRRVTYSSSDSIGCGGRTRWTRGMVRVLSAGTGCSGLPPPAQPDEAEASVHDHHRVDRRHERGDGVDVGGDVLQQPLGLFLGFGV